MARTTSPKNKRSETQGEAIALDDLDWKILDELRVNGRASYGAIAKKVGLSETGTRHRVNRLIKASICEITVTIDARRIGLNAIASVGVHVEGATEPVVNELAAVPEVAFLARTLGNYDIIAELFCRDIEELTSVIENKVRRIEGVTSVDVNLITDMPKFIVNPMINPGR